MGREGKKGCRAPQNNSQEKGGKRKKSLQKGWTVRLEKGKGGFGGRN